ncbi:MAG TPA: hypothetical protein VGQ95_06225 [Chthoniobacterales bacterium]|nr:hypothetical protein [Chthoniobacterales bacterium]
MDDWEDHARQVHERGLIGYYHANPWENHPPFISEFESLLVRGADGAGVPFRILFRAPFALLDAGSTFLLIALLRRKPWRFLAAVCYWLSPAAVILSSYHGNTDSAVAFFLLLCVWLLTKGQTIGGAIALGAGFWIKLPGILAVPALIILVQGWRRRLVFLLIAGVTGLCTYLPALVQDFGIVYTNVFGYRGTILKTAGGTPVWGPSVLLFSTVAPITTWPEKYLRIALSVLDHSWQIAIALLLVLSWLRRHRHSAEEVCATIGMVYTIVYGFSDYWAFQYFAWSLPFWFFLPRWFSIPAVCVASAYLYSLHWLLCGNGWLLGRWDFMGHPYWPVILLAFRDLAVSFFFLSACLFLILAMRRRAGFL